MKENIMIDLETLGTKPDSAILSIGAVTFDEDGIGSEFYVNTDLESQLNDFHKRKIDSGTFYWWAEQSSEAGKSLKNDRRTLGDALSMFEFWLMNNADLDNVKVWGNGADFDNVIITSAFGCQKWKFWNNRCFRTFLAITNADRVKPVTAHNALDDAKAQAQTIINHWNK